MVEPPNFFDANKYIIQNKIALANQDIWTLTNSKCLSLKLFDCVEIGKLKEKD